MPITPRNSISASASLPALGLAAAEVVHEHVHLPELVHDVRRVVAEPPRDGVGHDAEALAELVDLEEHGERVCKIFRQHVNTT